MWFQDKVEILEVHNQFVRSVSQKFHIPSVIRLKKYVKIQEHPKIRFSRENVYLRDGHRCQYCTKKFHPKDLTLDHVIPSSQGGTKEWTNIVTACRPCNQQKANQTPDEANIKLRRQPFEPKWLPTIRMNFNTIDAPESWTTFLKKEA